MLTWTLVSAILLGVVVNAISTTIMIRGERRQRKGGRG